MACQALIRDLVLPHVPKPIRSIRAMAAHDADQRKETGGALQMPIMMAIAKVKPRVRSGSIQYCASKLPLALLVKPGPNEFGFFFVAVAAAVAARLLCVIHRLWLFKCHSEAKPFAWHGVNIVSTSARALRPVLAGAGYLYDG